MEKNAKLYTFKGKLIRKIVFQVKAYGMICSNSRKKIASNPERLSIPINSFEDKKISEGTDEP
jgi:hypothetical protein